MEREVVVERVLRLFGDELSIDVASPTTDLIETGLLDSLALVELLAAVEIEFGIDVPLDEIELEQVRTLQRLTDLVTERVALAATDAA
jgi:acyl carrier protein